MVNLGLPFALRAVKHRNFRLFLGGQLISLTGTWMQSVAQSWLVYRLTGSPFLLGLVSFSGQFPLLALGPLPGIVADRFSRRRVVLATQTFAMLQAFLLALLTLGGWIQIWQLFALSLGLGIITAFDIPARQAFIVEMVGEEDLMNAIALNSATFNGARLAGPALAGVIVGAFGEGLCFFLNGLSFLAVIAGLLVMRVPPRPVWDRPLSTGAYLREGIIYVVRTPHVRGLLLLLGLVSLVGTPFAVVMPIFAAETLHGGPEALGVLMGAAGGGALAGAFHMARRKGSRGLERSAPRAAGLFGASLILFSFSRTLWLASLLLVMAGAGMMIQLTSTNTLLQSMVPDGLRGRLMSFYAMTLMGLAPIGSLLAGVLAQEIGAPGTVAIGGVLCLLGASWFTAYLPRLGRAGLTPVLEKEHGPDGGTV